MLGAETNRFCGKKVGFQGLGSEGCVGLKLPPRAGWLPFGFPFKPTDRGSPRDTPI